MSRLLNKPFSEWLNDHARYVIFAFLAVSALLVVPLVTMAPDEDASQEPSGEVFDLQHEIDNTFVAPDFTTSYILEARDGDALDQATLYELYQREQALLAADAAGELAPDALPSRSFLYETYDPDTGRSYVGLSTLADAVQAVLTTNPAFGVTLAEATDEQVKLALHFLLSDPASAGLQDSLSVEASRERVTIEGQEIDIWTSPALVVRVSADNEALGGASSSGLAADDTTLDKEDFALNVQEVLRGDEESYQLWGVAIDQNREIEAEGQIAGQFITFTVIAAVIVAGIAMRSYWAVALTGAGLGFLMLWLKGWSNLLGLEGGLIVSLIVPIAMISLGIDFAVHAVGRYREERQLGYPPRRAFAIGLGGVMSALVLAAVSDSIAFLSNTASGIEAITQFGIAAAIATVSSFIVLGLIVPLALSRIEELEARVEQPGRARRLTTTLVGGFFVAGFSGAAVIFFAAIAPPIGVAVLLVSVLFTIVAPWLLLRRRATCSNVAASTTAPVESSGTVDAEGVLPAFVATLAHGRAAVVVVAAALTAVAGFYALQLEATFDVKDFFDSSSDFVVGLDKVDEHIGDRGGEPGNVLIDGDLTDPATVAEIVAFEQTLETNDLLAHDSNGKLETNEPNLLATLALLTTNNYASGQVEASTGIALIDADGDGLPDSREAIEAAYQYALTEGIPLDEQTQLYSAAEVATGLEPSENGYEALFTVSIPGSREQSVVTAARESLEAPVAELAASPGIDRVGLTGSPFTRERTLIATTDSLQTAIPLAGAGAFILLLIVFRSVRYAVVTIIPVGLVAIWLYAVMELSGFALNFVTATIGAISIGIGIDYSIHMTERFREELARTGERFDAVRRAAAGTGSALVASAVSSIVGFAILGLAPMPMFASYGILTAIMILLALLASLLVLPSLLVIASPATETEVQPDTERRPQPAVAD